MRQSIISILEGSLYIFIAIATVGGFAAGGSMGIFEFNAGTALIGGALGLFSAIVASGTVFLLLEINDNVKRQADAAEALRRQQSYAQPGHPTAPAYPTPQFGSTTIPAPARASAAGAQAPSASAGARLAALVGESGVDCPQCGVRNRADRRVCWECGASLVDGTTRALNQP